MTGSAGSGPTASRAATEHRKGVAAAPARPLRCLLVEDSPFDRSLVRYSADRGGVAIDFIEVRTLGQARECLEEEDFGLVILDRRLPDGDALEACSGLAAGTRNTGVPIIMLCNDAGEIGAALSGGSCIGCIAKEDLSPERLARAVRKALVRQTDGPGDGTGDDLHVLLGALSDASRFARIRPLCSRMMTVVSELRRSSAAISDPAAAAALEELSELCLMLWIDLDGASGETPAGHHAVPAPGAQKG